MIVFPMAGVSRRFAQAGYDRPKYMLPLGDGNVFDRAVGGFSALFGRMHFLFIVCDVVGTTTFIAESCRRLGLPDPEVVILDAPTSGQAETVELGLDRAHAPGDGPITIFNIDTFRPGFAFPTAPWFADSDGYLEVFRGAGANWSYVRPSRECNGRVLQTTEKVPVSDLCCTGLYHFARTADFRTALAAERAYPSAPELYVAPIYNHLIAQGRRIHFHQIEREDVVFCGVPAEYEALRATVGSLL